MPLARRLTKCRTLRGRRGRPLEARLSRYGTLPNRIPIKPGRPLKAREKARVRLLSRESEAPTAAWPNPTA